MFDRELAVALKAVNDAAQIIMRVYATEFSVHFKGRNDPVTEADRTANVAIVAALQAAFPDDAICAEEASDAESLAAARRGGRCWFVDPLDGTREFVSRNGEFCVMVGLAVDGEARLGVVQAPAWNRTLWGVVGEGAFERGVDDVVRALHVADSLPSPREARLVVSRSHMHPGVRHVAEELGIADMRPCGSVGLKVALVSTGEADLYVHVGPGPKLWDGCAPEAIARAAGALVTDGSGRPLTYVTDRLPLDQGLVIAAPALHAAALAVYPR